MSKQDDTQRQAGDPMKMGAAMHEKMMAQMSKEGADPMAMMHKMMARMEEGGQAPPPMMQMCMSMCGEMLTAIKRTSEMAAFATPEVQALFAAWLETMQDRAVQRLREHGAEDVADLAAALNISEESTALLLTHLVKGGRVALRAELTAGSG